MIAFLSAAACVKNEVVPEENGILQTSGCKVSFTAYTESDGASAAGTKATIELNSSGKPQTFWEDGDVISVYSSGQGMKNSKTGYLFTTVLAQNSSSAVFDYVGNDFLKGDYIAIYPHTEAARIVNFEQNAQSATNSPAYEGTAYRMAQVSVPASQTLVEGGFDRSAMVMTAYASGSDAFSFKNAVALVKFKVSGSDVVSGKIVAPGSAISGTFRADILSEDTRPVLTDYGKTVYYYVNFSTGNDKALTPGEDYYVAVRPADLPEGFEIYLNGILVKKFPSETLSGFQRNKIYNLGTLAVPEPAVTKTLSFDFSSNPNGWPESGAPTGLEASDIQKVYYPLNGVYYEFLLANPLNASISFPYYKTSSGLYLSNYRYLGLPALRGYKLTSVIFTNASESQSTSRKLGVASTLGISSGEPEYVAGGEALVASEAKSYDFDLFGTRTNTVYYLHSHGKPTVISNVTLTYTRTDEYEVADDCSEITHRIGTFNLRVITNEDNEQNNWANRKTRVISAIKNCDFDVFGVNECSSETQSYIAEQLQDIYTCKFFSPYSQDGSGNKAQGVVYRKGYTLSDWNYFWLSDTPGTMTLNDGGKYSRGGCCGILTHNATGTKIFIMATHGILDNASRDAYAHIYADMEKKYNPDGYPSFFVGDLNASPSSAATQTYLKYWEDARLQAPADAVTGPVSTYNGFDLTSALNKDSKRIDYVFYRNATPLNYVCDNTKYDGYYPSDHLPIYSDMEVLYVAK